MEYIKIGHTKKSYGTKGEIKTFVEEAFVDDFLRTTVVFLEIGGKKLPFFIDNIREGGGFLVKFEEVDDKSQANSLTSKTLFLRDSDVAAKSEEEMTGLKYGWLKGYILFEEATGEIGEIEAVYDLPQQEMAEVTYNGKQLLIPLNDDLIVKIDKITKKITMELPDGLLSL